MTSLIAYKIKYNGSLLNDLPPELKYRVMDLLKPTSVKKCRLINKYFKELIDNCDKYTKYWILDVLHRPVTKDQEFVKLYIGSTMKFGSFVSDDGYADHVFTHVPQLFEKLGKTVTRIEGLPFHEMDLKTISAVVSYFGKVEDLKISGNDLIRKMKQLKIVWSSVKRLTIFCGSKFKKYTGNFAEFPNVEEIILKFDEYYEDLNHIFRNPS